MSEQEKLAMRCPTVLELREHFLAGTRSPLEVVDSALNRIEEHDEVLHAFVAIDVEGARHAARESSERYAAGTARPLEGIPVGVKDTIEVDGMPTTLGSLAFADYRAPDALVAQRLRAAGAVIIGKTNTPEFALGPRTRNRLGPEATNPWDLSRTCGGSSGGSASAVAAGMVPLTIGTDSAGSIRLPAALNGVAGIKPTYGRIPAVQVWRGAPGRSHLGLLAADIADLTYALPILAGTDQRDPASRLAALSSPPQVEELSVGVVIPRQNDGAWWETGMLIEVAEALRSRAARVEVIETDFFNHPPNIGREAGTWLYACEQVEGAEAVRPGFLAQHLEDLYETTRAIFEYGAAQLAADYRRGMRAVASYGAEASMMCEPYDILITPMAGPAQKLTEEIVGSRYVWPFNITGQPSLSVPWQPDESTGLPLAVQVVAMHSADVTALVFASLIEELSRGRYGRSWGTEREQNAQV